MKLLDRYVASQFLKIFLICVLGVPFLFIVIDVTDNLDTYLAEGATTVEVVLHYVYELPYHALLAFPIAALLASVFTISTMTRHFETTAIKAGGVSFYRMVVPVLLGSIGLSLVALLLTDIVPVYNRKAEEVLGQEKSRSQTIRNTFAFRANAGRVYWIRRLDAPAGTVADLQIHREGTGVEYPTYAVFADSAAWDSTRSRWAALNGRLHFLPDEETVRTFQFDELWQRMFTETPEELLATPKEEIEMQYEELGRFIEAMERSGAEANKLIVERAQRISFPFTCFIIVLFGAPLGHSTRRGGAPVSLGIALATTILFLILINIFEALGAGGVVDPVLAAWLPNLVFLAAGGVLMAYVRT